MNYWEEFELIETKFILAIEDINLKEIQLYLDHMIEKGELNSLEEIFEPPLGESIKYAEKYSYSDELKIRKWLWKYKDKKYEILDIHNKDYNSEYGVIAIQTSDNQNYLIVAVNSDRDLIIIEDHEFESRLIFFQNLRILCLEHSPESENFYTVDDLYFNKEKYNHQLTEFEKSSDGIAAFQIEKERYQTYLSKLEEIEQENFRLQTLYLQEFDICQLSDDEYHTLFKKSPSLSLNENLEKFRSKLYHITWLNNGMQLLYFKFINHFLFLINKDQQLIEIFNNWYFSGKEKTLLMSALCKRIHSLKYLISNFKSN